MKGIVAILCGLVGYLLAQFLPDGALAVYAPMMIAYHLFLLFLVVTTVQDKGFSLSPVPMILTHVSCLALLVIFAEARAYIPYFSIIRFFTPGIASFEAAWLFAGKGKKVKAAVDTSDPMDGTGQDYEDFILYLRQNERPFSKPGRSVKEEYKFWLAYRAKNGAINSGTRPAA
ncbi:MAG TPA: hypothetical protein VL991_11545 [Terracidiphilus sp.]|nr:hypothetical protein [Terracidiphilus sp.]